MTKQEQVPFTSGLAAIDEERSYHSLTIPRTVSLSPPKKNTRQRRKKKKKRQEQPTTVDRLLEIIDTATQEEEEERHASLSRILYGEVLLKRFDRENHRVEHPLFFRAFSFEKANRLLAAVLADKATATRISETMHERFLETAAEVDAGAPPRHPGQDGVSVEETGTESSLSGSVPPGDAGSAS